MCSRSASLVREARLHAVVLVQGRRRYAPDLSALREGGVDPRLVIAALARSAGLLDAGVERVSAAELVGSFDIAKLPREPGVLRLFRPSGDRELAIAAFGDRLALMLPSQHHGAAEAGQVATRVLVVDTADIP